MKNGLAIWHYGHRTPVENAEFFAKQGFDSVSILGMHMVELCRDAEQSAALAEVIDSTGIVLTVHFKLPASAEDDEVVPFREGVAAMGEWQKRYGGISILSFDVPMHSRENLVPYIEYVLEAVPDCKVAVEDFGLTESELEQTKTLTDKTDRFGYLLDIGHMYIRLKGQNTSGSRLFTTSLFECDASEHPDRNAFLKAFLSKPAPIFEMHLHNNDGARDLHNFLEDGTMDVDEAAAAIYDFGFDGVMTIESAPGYTFECFGKDADDGIMRTFEYWKNAYNKASNK